MRGVFRIFDVENQEFIDVYERFGVFVVQDGYNGLVGYPSLKTPEMNDWAEEDGTEVDLSAPTLDVKEFQMSFATRKANGTKGFVDLLSKRSHYSWEFADLQWSFTLRFVGQRGFAATGGLEVFSLQLADDFPLPDGYSPPTASGLPPTGYEVDGVDFAFYGVRILKGSRAEVLRYPDVKKRLTVSLLGEDGVSYDGATGRGDALTLDVPAMFQARDVKLGCLMRAESGGFRDCYYGLIRALTAPGERVLSAEGRELRCYYKSCGVKRFRCDGKVWFEFDLTLVAVRFRPLIRETIAFEDFICHLVPSTSTILIYTAEDFLAIPNDAATQAILMADIDFGGITLTKHLIYIRGGFYGNGHRISNFSIANYKIRQASAYTFNPLLRDVTFSDISYNMTPPTDFAFGEGRYVNCRFENIVVTKNLNGGISAGHGWMMSGRPEKCTFRNILLNQINTGDAYTIGLLRNGATDCVFENVEGIGVQYGMLGTGASDRIVLKSCTVRTSGSQMTRASFGASSYPKTAAFSSSISNSLVINSSAYARGLGVFSGPGPGTGFMSRVTNCFHTEIGGSHADNSGWDAIYGYNGTLITDSEARDRGFYEALGYDFDGVWRTGADGYPELAPQPNESPQPFDGLAYAKNLVYRKYNGMKLVETKSVSVKAKANPNITDAQYSTLPPGNVVNYATLAMNELRAQTQFETEPEVLNGAVREDPVGCPVI